MFVAVGLGFAGASGYLASAAIGQAEEPTRTVTVDVATGPQGPPGPPGEFSCLAGYSPGILVINAPRGQVKTYTCLED
jgi:hypothetical protein